MRVVEIVFSPTGGTKKVANIITSSTTLEVVEADLIKGSTVDIDKDDLCVIAVPSFGGRVPRPVKNALLQFNGNKAKTILVCVYGNREYEDTLVELEDISKEANFNPIGAISAIARHSLAKNVAQGRPNKEDEIELKAYMQEIMENLECCTLPNLNGNRPYKKEMKLPLYPKSTSSCVKCGLCIKECPTKAILQDYSLNRDLCISCMHCVDVCPKKARQLSTLIAKGVELGLGVMLRKPKENQLFIEKKK